MDKAQQFDWPVTAPHIEVRRVIAEDIDAFNHVNNVRYIAWTADAAWGHSNALGVSFADYERIGVGFVVQRHEFEYLYPLLEGEEAHVATWIHDNDGRVRTRRRYEIRRGSDGKLCFKGETMFVTIDMKTGKPARMPKEFAEIFKKSL